MPSPADPTTIKKVAYKSDNNLLQAFQFFWSIETDASCCHNIMNQFGDANQQGSYHSKVHGIYGPSLQLTFDTISNFYP